MTNKEKVAELNKDIEILISAYLNEKSLKKMLQIRKQLGEKRAELVQLLRITE